MSVKLLKEQRKMCISLACVAGNLNLLSCLRIHCASSLFFFFDIVEHAIA